MFCRDREVRVLHYRGEFCNTTMFSIIVVLKLRVAVVLSRFGAFALFLRRETCLLRLTDVINHLCI